MKRTLLIVLLSAGTLVGFASGCASIACHVHRHHQRGAAHWKQFESHVADVCLRAAERAPAEPAKAPPPTP